MFRDVPECSGMFHVPGFIDGRSLNNHQSRDWGNLINLIFHA